MPRPQNNILRELFDSNDNNEIVCRNGSCSGKILSNHAGNLQRHLKKLHIELYEKYIKNKVYVNNGVQKDKMKISIEINKTNIKKAIVELFSKNGRPLRMAGDNAFKILTQPVLDVLGITLNEHNVIERIISFSNEIKENITKELNGRLISLKIDAATRQNLSVLGINVQYIKNKNIIIQTLGIKELKEKHTAEYLKSVMLEVLGNYKIHISQILTVTTDNGANMVKTINELNADLKNSIEHENTEHSNENENSLLSIERCFYSDMITNIRCGAHTLQLCVNDVLKIDEIKEKLEKFRHVAKKLRNQTYLNLLKNGGYKKPILDCVTRWNSSFNMLQRLSELKEIILSLSSDNAEFLLSDDDWGFAAEFLKTFVGIYTASVKLQSEKLYYSDLYIIMMDIILQTENLPRNDMQIALLEALNKRKSKLFDNDLFNAAVYLDPRVKILLEPEQIEKAKRFITQLHSRIALLRGTISNTEEPTTSSQVSNTPRTLSDLLCSVDPNPASGHSITSLNLHFQTDLLMYDRQPRMPLDSNLMEFWSAQNNTLTCLAEIILAIPCTQVSVERLFSALKYILSDQRNKLTGDPLNLEHILLVRANGVFEYGE